MTAYLERMPAGIPGAVSRAASATLETGIIGASPVAFGSLVKLVNGKIEAIGAGDTAANVYGLLARTYPTQGSAMELGGGTAAAGMQQSILRRGYMTVLLKGGTAAKRGQVYVRITAGSGRVPGDLEAAADGANTISVAGCYFMGPADAGGNTEIEFNI